VPLKGESRYGRVRAVCGLEAVLEATGQRFGEVEAERMGARDAAAQPAYARSELT
jgi:hypothetical protein